MAVSYVKFFRGSQSLYDSLTTKDKDTLYFTYDDSNPEYGRLYLGNRLISDDTPGSSGGKIKLSDVTDVALKEGIADGDILVYNEATKQWENSSLTKVISDISAMTGATATADGTAGLVPAPKAGEQDKYLRGDGTWGAVEASLSEADQQSISGLKTQVATLIGDDADKSARQIANEELVKQLIPENAQESLDSLSEIAAWIQSHPTDASEMNTKIINLQTDVADLKETLNGSTENPDSGLDTRVTKLENTVGTLTPVEGKYLNVGEAVEYLDNSISALDDRLRWHEMSEEEK